MQTIIEINFEDLKKILRIWGGRHSINFWDVVRGRGYEVAPDSNPIVKIKK